MKKIMILAVMSLLSLSLYAQDTTRTVAGVRYYVDSLTTTKDTIDFQFDWDAIKSDKVQIFATSSAVDTVEVYVNSPDGVRWAKEGVIDFATNTVIATVIGATTTKELQVISPRPVKVRLVSLSNDGSVCYVVVSARRTIPYEN